MSDDRLADRCRRFDDVLELGSKPVSTKGRLFARKPTIPLENPVDRWLDRLLLDVPSPPTL